jgi:shikimate dehydrogenase
MKPYAEVIGDPVAQSRSPAVHGAWLAEAGIDAAYHATRLTRDDLADFFASRRDDPFWRGCNVTAPLKQAVIPFIDRLDPAAAEIGAVNCIVPEPAGLTGYNTDVDGAFAALDGSDLEGGIATLIGAGGAARAGLHALQALGAQVRILARSPDKARALGDFAIFPFERTREAMAGASAIVNASTLGMAHADPMPDALLAALPAGALVFDMVYHPEETALLAAARARGLRTVGGLVMLEGQARRAFRLFFGGLTPSGQAA